MRIKARPCGDIATCYCDATKAKRRNSAGWQRGIEEMCGFLEMAVQQSGRIQKLMR